MDIPREVPRKSVAAEVKLRRSGELNYVVHAFDLSEKGCKLEFVERPIIGEIVWVKFEGLAAIESTVRWTENFVVGLEFRRPLYPAVLETLVARLN